MTDQERAEAYAAALRDIIRLVGEPDGMLQKWIRDRAEVALEIGEEDYATRN
jgi:hypothetical protein